MQATGVLALTRVGRTVQAAPLTGTHSLARTHQYHTHWHALINITLATDSHTGLLTHSLSCAPSSVHSLILAGSDPNHGLRQHDAAGFPMVNKDKFPDLKWLVAYGHSKNVKMGWYLVQLYSQSNQSVSREG